MTQEMVHAFEIDVGVIFNLGSGKSLMAFIMESRQAIAVVKNKALAAAYAGAGRSDDALAAYRDFMAGKGFTIPAGDAAATFDPDLGAAPDHEGG